MATRLCEVRGCGRSATLIDPLLDSAYCTKHIEVWEAELEVQLDHTLRRTGSRLDANATWGQR